MPAAAGTIESIENLSLYPGRSLPEHLSTALPEHLSTALPEHLSTAQLSWVSRPAKWGYTPQTPTNKQSSPKWCLRGRHLLRFHWLFPFGGQPAQEQQEYIGHTHTMSELQLVSNASLSGKSVRISLQLSNAILPASSNSFNLNWSLPFIFPNWLEPILH